MATSRNEDKKAARARRRVLRRLAREAVCEAAEDMDMGLLKFGRLLKKKDPEAVACFVLATRDIGDPLGIDWDDFDWEGFFEMLLRFIEALMLLFG